MLKTPHVAAIMAAARAQANRMDRAVTIIVVDTAGIPLALERCGEPAGFTSIAAEGKAVASAFMGRDSSAIAPMAERLPQFVNALTTRLGGRFIAAPGGLVLARDGEVVGAIGVSGATSEEDEEIAKAGAAAHMHYMSAETPNVHRLATIRE